jgi:prepilin-type N-terminal cleavage/methylation domain-containing protein
VAGQPYMRDILQNKFRIPGVRGFTLLEIMIALAIIGTTLTIILHTINYHADVMYENILTTQMYQLAKEKIVELETTLQDSRGTIDNTNFTYENKVFKQEDSDIIELKTTVKGYGKKVVLSEFVIKKTDESN